MTVTYQLSWDEVLEGYENSMPRVRVASFFCLILMASVVGMYGCLLLYFVEPTDWVPGSIFCWTSLGLLLLAIQVRVGTKGRKRRFIQSLREFYGRNYDSEQVFGFDHEEWMHQTPNGKHQAPWNRLRYATEHANVVCLWATHHVVILPKRVFRVGATNQDAEAGEAPSLIDLRKAAFGEPITGTPCRISFADYSLTEVATLWQRRTFAMAAAHMAGLLFVVLIADGIRRGIQPSSILAWSVAALVLFLTITTQFWYFLIQYLSVFREARTYFQPELSERGLHGKNSKLEFFNAWSVFTKFRETRRCFLLYSSTSAYQIQPKRCLSADRQAALHKFLETKVAVE
jgi:YcxB-like protein